MSVALRPRLGTRAPGTPSHGGADMRCGGQVPRLAAQCPRLLGLARRERGMSSGSGLAVDAACLVAVFIFGSESPRLGSSIGHARHGGWRTSRSTLGCRSGLLVAVRRPHSPPSRSIPGPLALHHFAVAGRLVARDRARSSLAAFRPRPPAPWPRSRGTEGTSMGRSSVTNMPACAGQRQEALGRWENARVGQGDVARC